MDKLSTLRRSANMRAIRAKDTRPELAVRKALRATGLSGYRLHRKDLPGRPDIAFMAVSGMAMTAAKAAAARAHGRIIGCPRSPATKRGTRAIPNPSYNRAGR